MSESSSDGEVFLQIVSLPAVQGLPEAHSGGDESLWSRHGYRTGQHRLQLRHARRLRHLSSSCESGSSPILVYLLCLCAKTALSRLLELVVSGPKVWPLHSSAMRTTPRSSTTFRIASTLTLESSPTKSMWRATVSTCHFLEGALVVWTSSQLPRDDQAFLHNSNSLTPFLFCFSVEAR